MGKRGGQGAEERVCRKQKLAHRWAHVHALVRVSGAPADHDRPLTLLPIAVAAKVVVTFSAAEGGIVS